MADIKLLLDKLNDEQIKPVLDTEGAVLVIAGAGSGKTRVLTSRIAYLVQEKGVSPSNIMAITFTNKAAGEMKERLEKLVGDVNEMWVSTIHSMCVRILRRDIDKLGYDKNFTIYDETDKDKVLKRVIEELGLDNDNLLKTAKNAISNAKNECLNPEEWKNAYKDLHLKEDIYQIYKAYENQLARSNSLDFDDLLYKTYLLFEKREDVADYYSNKFHYVHIDEFQDTNSVQFAIAQRLCKKHGNIFAVGDDDQSIYGWRGAKIENILSFDDIFRGAKVYKLERNYRSTKKILQLANCIIANNTNRRQKELWTENDEGVKIETFVGGDENNEATFVALQIKNLMARSNELNYNDFAVFMRVNALSRAFEQEFMKYGIPCKVFGGFRFFERKEIKDLLAYLKVINNRNDDESFLRCIATPKRGIGDKTLRELREFCASASISLYDGLWRLEQTNLSSSVKSKLFNFGMLLESFSEYSKNNSVSKLLEHIIDSTGFDEQFLDKTEENSSRLYNISELKNSAEQFEKDNYGCTLADYLNSVTLSSDTDDINSDQAVTIATIHASKGLEYKCVFVVGLDETILPIARSVNNESEMEEERRLMYVAVTRAMQRLYLTRAMSRYMYGRREKMVQSRFIKEAQSILSPKLNIERTTEKQYNYSYRENYSDDDGYTSSQGYSSNYAKTFMRTAIPKENKSIQADKFKSGVKVKHVKFGEGIVISVKGSGDNVIVDVAFKGVGVKSLSAKYAPMEIV